LQNTRLGYIVPGTDSVADVKGQGKSGQHAFFIYTDPLHIQLEKFWTVESLNNRVLTVEEKECERHFQETTVRLEDGKYQVRLPIRKDHGTLGESYDTALRRLHQLEGRLDRQPQLGEDYKFMDEYLHLNP
jgi:hypothetical protein